jgi:hypothetical protein
MFHPVLLLNNGLTAVLLHEGLLWMRNEAFFNKGKELASLATNKAGVDVIDYNPKLSHLYLSSDMLSVIGVSDQGEFTLLATEKTSEGAHCTIGDDQDNIWVCDPQHGQLLLYKDGY